jgi:hypothetical protein
MRPPPLASALARVVQRPTEAGRPLFYCGPRVNYRPHSVGCPLSGVRRRDFPWMGSDAAGIISCFCFFASEDSSGGQSEEPATEMFRREMRTPLRVSASQPASQPTSQPRLKFPPPRSGAILPTRGKPSLEVACWELTCVASIRQPPPSLQIMWPRRAKTRCSLRPGAR